MFFKTAALLVLILCYPLSVHALTKAEALQCVNQGINTFLKGGPITHLVDTDYMIARENISASAARVDELLNERARSNKGYYQNVSANVVGVPQAKSNGFFLVAGTVKGEETESLDTVVWKPFKYQYVLWVKKEGDRCRIGVLAIEEVFRLASWVKTNL